MEQTSVALANLLGDVAIPPIGGKAIIAIVGVGRFDGDVIGASQFDDIWSVPGDSRKATAFRIRNESDAEFRTGIRQCGEITDPCLDGGEM